MGVLDGGRRGGLGSCRCGSVLVQLEIRWKSAQSLQLDWGRRVGVMRDVMLFTEQRCMLESQHRARTPPGAPLVELRCHKIFSCCDGGWSWIRIISEVCSLFVFDFSSDCSYSRSGYKQTPPLPLSAALFTDRTLLHCPYAEDPHLQKK